jgi:hypothetical protein
MAGSELLKDVFRSLILNTRFSVSFKVHYYCQASEASLDRILDQRDLLFATSCRPVPIETTVEVPEGYGTEVGVSLGALRLDNLPNRGDGAKHLRPVDRKSKPASLISQWERDVDSDLLAINRALQVEAAHSGAAQYVCLPEFGLPYFPISSKGKPRFAFSVKADHPYHWPKALANVQEELLHVDRFVCLGSAHLAITPKQGGPVKYQNVSVVFPQKLTASLKRDDVFREKRNRLPIGYKSNEVVITPSQNGSKLTANFPNLDTTVVERLELEFFEKGKAVDYAKEAFDYFYSTERTRFAPIYVTKNNPARRMGEYLDPETSIVINVFVTKNGVVSTIICYDIFDPAIFLALVRQYFASKSQDAKFSHPSPDIFLIPAYNKHPAFVKACQTLSFMTQSIVFYTSGYSDCLTGSALFVCGMKLSDLADDLGEGFDMKITEMDYIRVGRITRSIYEKAMNKSSIAQMQMGVKDHLFSERRLGVEALL